MSSVSSTSTTSTGIADLMQIFSSAATPAISSLLSSSNVQAALAKAPPSDIVQLSDQAMQLQEVDSLFGGTDAPAAQSPGLEMQDALTALYSPVNLLA